MPTSPQPSSNRTFHFQCPHCEGYIAFAVEAFVESDSTLDYGDEWEDEEEEWEDEEWSAYYDSMEKMQSLIRLHQYADAVPLISDNAERLLEEFGSGEEMLSLYVPAFEQGARVLAMMGETERLNRMHEIVTSSSVFRGYVAEIEKHQREVLMFQAIREAVRDNPNCLQPDVKVLIGEADGRHVASLIGYLENSGEVVKVRDGRKIRLSLA